MLTLQQNEAAARRCVDLFNKGNVAEWIAACYAENAEWIELPLPTTPLGRGGNRAVLRDTAEQILRLLPDRRMEIRNLVAQDNQVVLELDWWGTAAATVGNLRAGSVVRLRVATFLTLAAGLIVKQTDYCVPIRDETARS